MNNSEDIDRLAQSFFIVLISCSLMNDSYILINDFFKNNYVKKKINYIKNICDISYNLAFNNYKNDNEGNIIIDKTNIVTEDLNDNSDIDDVFEEDEKHTSEETSEPLIIQEDPQLEVSENQPIIYQNSFILDEVSETLSQTTESLKSEANENSQQSESKSIDNPKKVEKPIHKKKSKNIPITITKKINNEEINILKSNTKMIKNKKTK